MKHRWVHAFIFLVALGFASYHATTFLRACTEHSFWLATAAFIGTLIWAWVLGASYDRMTGGA